MALIPWYNSKVLSTFNVVTVHMSVANYFLIFFFRAPTWQISAQSCCFMEISLKSQQAISRNASSSCSTTSWFTVRGSPGEEGDRYPTTLKRLQACQRKHSNIFVLADYWKKARHGKLQQIPVCADRFSVCKQNRNNYMCLLLPYMSLNVHVLKTQVLVSRLHQKLRMFSLQSVTTVLSHFLGFLERSPPRGPSLSTGPSMCSEAESTPRWWRWKMWKMEQVGVCPSVLPLETVYMSIHETLPGHVGDF